LPVTAIAAALALGAACSPERLAASTALSLAERTKGAFSQESELELARASIPGGLKQLEGFLLVTGKRRDVLQMLAEGYCGWGAGFLQDDWEAEVLERGGDGRALAESARVALGRCARYAAWQLPAPLDRVMELPEPAARAALAAARPADAVPLYRIASAHATLLGVTGELLLALRAPRMIAVLRRVVALAPELDDGQAQLLLAVLLASAPRVAGGDLDEAERRLAAARQRSGGRLLIVDVLEARAVAVATGDRARFFAALVRAATTAPSVWPERRLANELAQRKARRYLRVGERAFWGGKQRR
jgi:hypothetical protein